MLHTPQTYQQIRGWYSVLKLGVILYPGGLILTAETVQIQDSLVNARQACTPSPLTAGLRFNHAGDALILEPLPINDSDNDSAPNPASPRHWLVQVATTVWCRYAPVSLLIDSKRVMPAAAWSPAEGPNLVGSIFKRRERRRIRRGKLRGLDL